MVALGSIFSACRQVSTSWRLFKASKSWISAWVTCLSCLRLPESAKAAAPLNSMLKSRACGTVWDYSSSCVTGQSVVLQHRQVFECHLKIQSVDIFWDGFIVWKLEQNWVGWLWVRAIWGKKNFSHYKNNKSCVCLFLRALQAKRLRSEWNCSLAKEKHTFKKKVWPYSREIWGCFAQLAVPLCLAEGPTLFWYSGASFGLIVTWVQCLSLLKSQQNNVQNIDFSQIWT